jgi:2,3-bisphosphoglycerate-independent phosphoglycerate mutase
MPISCGYLHDEMVLQRAHRFSSHRPANAIQVYKIIEGAVERGVKRLRVHALADGRDVQDGSSVKFFGQMRDFLAKISASKGVDACIASGGGRMHVTMDRYEVSP